MRRTDDPQVVAIYPSFIFKKDRNPTIRERTNLITYLNNIICSVYINILTIWLKTHPPINGVGVKLVFN